MSTWLPVYGPIIKMMAEGEGLEPARLAALVWQESNGGISPISGLWTSTQLYRFEPAFWQRYLADKSEYASPDPSSLELWKRRVSASYGICQVLYATAKGTVCHHRLCKTKPVAFVEDLEPESLFDPHLNLSYAATILSHALNVSAGVWREAWLHYNGGGNLEYPVQAEAKYQRILELKSRWLK